MAMIDWAQRATAAQSRHHDVPSPCISVCIMDAERGVCTGCWRTLDEIATWATLSDASKRSIWAQIARRVARPGDL